MQSRFRFRFSIRTLAIFVGLLCIYLATWELTKKHGVMTSEVVLVELEKERGPIPAAISPPTERSPMPLLIERTEYGYFHSTRRFYIWLFGPRIGLN